MPGLPGLPPGPARFFAAHPGLHALSVALATGAAVALEARSACAKGPLRKAGWGILSLLEWGIVVGLMTLPRQGSGDEDSSTPSPTF